MDNKSVARTTLIQASIYVLLVLLVLLVVTAAEVFLLVFGGILFSLLLRGVATWLHEKSGMNEKLALTLAIVVPLALVALVAWLIAPRVSDQAATLAERLPAAFESLKAQLMQYEWVSRIWQGTDHLRQLAPDGSSEMKYVSGFFSSTFGMLANVVFILFVGLFLSINPSLYIKGLLLLVPPAKRPRTREVLNATGTVLRHWLVAKLAAMAVIGVLTTVGLMLLDIDLALILGVIAALLSFVPNFGPIVSVIPAVLIALVAGLDKALYVLLLYAAVQTVESYALTPYLQKRMVEMPPALLLTMQVLLGVLTGILGVIFATPLTAATMVLVRKFYVEDVLEQRKGEQGDGRAHGQTDARARP